MKRLAIIVVMALMSLTASANSVRYFTLPQAQRTVRYLNTQNELMLYCGYDYEIETYVLINEIWMERVNSAYYEIWVFGYDAYTGDEIIMPLDLQCVWLYSAGRMYNAAQYLRFHASVRTPGLTWYIPPYNPFTRRPHYAGYVRTYHYHVHTPGWRPPTPPQHGYGPHTQPPLPPYYMRTPQQPAPAPTTSWTPGVEHPQVTPSTPNANSHSNSSVPTSRPSGVRPTNDQSNGTATGTTRSSGTRESGTTGTTRESGNSNARPSSTGTTGTTRESGNSNVRPSGTGTSSTRTTNNTPTRTNTGTSTSEPRTSGTTTRTSGNTTTTSRNSGTTTRTSGNTTTTSRNSGTTTRNSGTTTGTRSSGNNTTRTSGTSNNEDKPTTTRTTRTTGSTPRTSR
ncbi:MAG: hypothetical protein J6V98_06785 [Bacteroidales bacterium]|nr:hypothetical protein [Bacteroidales bacterium]